LPATIELTIGRTGPNGWASWGSNRHENTADAFTGAVSLDYVIGNRKHVLNPTLGCAALSNRVPHLANQQVQLVHIETGLTIVFPGQLQ
jgi:hypothetical protein